MDRQKSDGKKFCNGFRSKLVPGQKWMVWGRLRLASFASVAYNIPLQHKRKRGKPKKPTSALVRQPDEFQPEEGVQLCSEEEEVLDEPVQEKIMPKKRGRPPKQDALNSKKSKKY